MIDALAVNGIYVAVDDLKSSKMNWAGIIEQIITEKAPFTDFGVALHQHSADEIKVVVDWSPVTQKLRTLEQ